MFRAFKSGIRNLQYRAYDFLYNDQDVIRADWYAGGYNFGDILNPVLLNLISGKRILNISSRYYRKEHIMAIGSILDRATRYSIVWGSGYISENSKCLEAPHKVHAVRGPKTRSKLIEQGIDCPAVYGDPALLMPFYYHPNIKKEFKLGIIPHYVDKKNDWIKKQEMDGTKIIDVQQRNPLNVIRDILSCEKIASTSLHGLIVSDAYNIPSLWIMVSDMIEGGAFKFMDYFESVGRDELEPVIVTEKMSCDELLKCFKDYRIDIDLKQLLHAFPYNIANSPDSN